MEFTKDIQLNNYPSANETLTINYHGFLSNSSELFIVYGFGESWENTSEMNMKKTKNGFTVEIEMLNFDTFNFCFRNHNYEWDNNSNTNYISPILPSVKEDVQVLFDELLTPPLKKVNSKAFDIDALIEEILEPLMIKSVEQKDVTPIQITSKPIDLGAEITNVLSQIANEPATQELVEYSTLDEILSGTVIEETPIELFEEKSSVDDIVNELIQNMSITQNTTNSIEPVTQKNEESDTENSLIPLEESFMISPRQLSKFYLFRKRLKLAFYKALVKIPKMIFGEENS